MGMFFTVFAPIVEFIVSHSVILITGLIIYLLLCFVFKGARGAISVIFGTIVLIYVLSNLGAIYDSVGDMFQNLAKSSENLSVEYQQEIEDRYLSDDSLSTQEKVMKSIEFGLLGRE